MNPLLSFIEHIRTFGLEILGLMYGVYFGKVKANTDNTFSGRVRFFLESLGLSDAAKLERDGFIEKYKKFFERAGFKIREKDNIQSALPISPYAGKNYGFYFPPELEQEANLMVVFPHGKRANPMYLGSWWSFDGIPVEFKNQDGSVTKRGIKTKSGHFILFEDSDQQDNVKRIEIHSSSGHKAVFNDKEMKVDIISKNGLVIEMDDNTKKIIIKANNTQIILDGNSGKVFLHVDGASQNFARGLDLISYLSSHRHVGAHGITTPPVDQPSMSMLSQNIFGE